MTYTGNNIVLSIIDVFIYFRNTKDDLPCNIVTEEMNTHSFLSYCQTYLRCDVNFK